MSLILEALRKSEAERRRGAPPQLLDPPLAPSPPAPAAAATRRVPAAGMASIAIAVAVLLGMTGYRMLTNPNDDAAPVPGVAAAGPSADPGPVASTAPTEPASSRVTTQAPVSTVATVSAAEPTFVDVQVDPMRNAELPAHETAVAATAPAAVPRSATTARLAETATSPGSARPSAAVATPGTPRLRDSAAVPQQPAGTAARPVSLPAGSTTASAAHASERQDRALPASGAASTAARRPDRSTDLAGTTPSPSTQGREPQRPLSTAPAPTASAPAPRTAPATAPASGAAERPVRLADLAPADRRALPPLRMSMHLFAAAPAERFVILDGQRVGEGDRVGEAIVDEITADGAVLAWRGQRVWVSVR